MARLGALAGLVLLMATTSAGGLQLARASARGHEIAVRLALGAGRTRLALQFLIESAVVGALAGAGGLLLASWANDLLAVGVFGEAGPAVPLDRRAVAFTAAVTLAITALLGLLPALRATGAGASPRPARLPGVPSRAWIAAQVAVSFVLLVGAGLLARTLANLSRVDTGFDRHSVVVFRLHATDRTAAAALIERLRALPGVQAAGSADHDLVEGDRDRRRVSIDGGPPLPKGRDLAYVNHVGGDFFAATGIAIRAGRALDVNDAGHPVMVVNEAFVREYLSGTAPVGRRVNGHEIVGVAEDTKYGRLRDPSPATMFVPPAAAPADIVYVRTERSPAAVAVAVTPLARDLGLAPYGFDTAAGQVARTIDAERFLTRLTVALGGLALLLAAVGLYGLMAFAVERRTRDIGVRMALGARPLDVWRWVMADAGRVTLAGIGVGVLGALIAGRGLGSVLYGVTPNDTATFAVAAVVLAASALLACWRPARRAAHVDPAAALRYE